MQLPLLLKVKKVILASELDTGELVKLSIQNLFYKQNMGWNYIKIQKSKQYLFFFTI